ncbi:hypothetical protein [Hymenobacter sp. UYCo722]|uniref:hypothetical protein n=1 Tax=Hymenobacter sp. UYCo722 TaxID=3156335 RepID=UPI003393DB54
MKKVFTIVGCCLMSAAAFASTNLPGKPGSQQQASTIVLAKRLKASHDPVVICHKGREITVDANAVQAHLAHGDKVGSCFSPTPAKSAL